MYPLFDHCTDGDCSLGHPDSNRVQSLNLGKFGILLSPDRIWPHLRTVISSELSCQVLKSVYNLIWFITCLHIFHPYNHQICAFATCRICINWQVWQIFAYSAIQPSLMDWTITGGLPEPWEIFTRLLCAGRWVTHCANHCSSTGQTGYHGIWSIRLLTHRHCITLPNPNFHGGSLDCFLRDKNSCRQGRKEA